VACEFAQPGNCPATLGARAVIPILNEGARIGWLVVKSHSLVRVPTFARAALEAIASRIGNAIERIQAQETLLASQRELKALFESLDDFLLVVDPHGQIVDANRSVLEHSGYSRLELIGMSIAELFPLPGQLDAMTANILEGQLTFIDLPMLAKDGTAIPVETRLGLGNWDGRRVIIGLGRDLTERRLAEQQTASLREKTALLKEIHHRIKNNLQIICSLLNLQAATRESGERTAFRESQSRIRAIALLHEKLYQSRDLSRIDISEYLGTLAQELLAAHRKPLAANQLHLDVAPAWLSQDTIMPCGLIVNELLTNSCKYAFPDGEPGEIYVSAQPDADGNLVLTVGDNGVGLPPGLNPSQCSTLGLQLVDDMVSQLKGSWTVESSHGARFRIVFPAEKGQ